MVRPRKTSSEVRRPASTGSAAETSGSISLALPLIASLVSKGNDSLSSLITGAPPIGDVMDTAVEKNYWDERCWTGRIIANLSEQKNGRQKNGDHPAGRLHFFCPPFFCSRSLGGVVSSGVEPMYDLRAMSATPVASKEIDC